MNFDVRTTPGFEKEFKALMKRHRSLKSDFGKLVVSLSENPMQGDELSPGIRKVRMAITSKGRGKSGGARVITYTIVTSERVYLMNIYDKADYSTVDVEVIKAIVRKMEEEI